MPSTGGDRSKAVFGSANRLAVLRSIAKAQPRELYSKRIQEMSGASPKRVGDDLRNLAEAGLLERLPHEEGSSVVRYKRKRSALWDVVSTLASEWSV